VASSWEEATDAGATYRDSTLVAAAVTTIPVLRFFRNLVVFLIE
jgi:hypothetical protein